MNLDSLLCKIMAVTVIGCVFSILSYATAQAIEVKSYLNKEALSQFVVNHFDLRTVQSSLGPKRISGQSNYFKDFGLTPTTIDSQEALFDGQDWFYGLKILGANDYNDDGIEDIFVCFTDKAKEGNYNSVTPLLLTRYNETMPLVALAYAPYDNACQRKGGD